MPETNPKKYFYSVGRADNDPVRTAEIKIRRSVFICSLAHAGTIESAKAFISRISKENKTATHNCWAYIVGDKGEISHSSDAGEPAGTAGKPMLNTLAGHGMTRVAAVVTRHFGGVKLGIRGLIEAYSESVEAALDQGKLVRLVNTRSFRIRLAYDFNDIFLNLITRFEPRIRDTRYSDIVEHDLEVEEIHVPGFELFLTEYRDQGRLKFETC
ncbi:IMPACT family protein [Desulfospira joergensenii]|uniref:IMPACT family protein n=1 Tax=Desulfospira joergensenii TaxID=53329 RepID=UPI0003FBFF5E|nr:YigZ family protein [Desulfospira joergensenii]